MPCYMFAYVVDDQPPTAPPHPYLGTSHAYWVLFAPSRDAPRLCHLTPITLPPPNFAISAYEEADADPAACWTHGPDELPPQAQLASRRLAV